MKAIGEVLNLEREFSFEWRIDNFFSLSEKCYVCPQFSFSGEFWYFTIFLNDGPEENSVGAYLHRKLAGTPISLSWSLVVKTSKGNHEMQFTHVFEKALGWGTHEFLKGSELSERKYELVRLGVLTIVCRLEYFKSSADAGKNMGYKCSYCERTSDIGYVLSHEQKCLVKPMRCPTCGNTFALRKWFDHGCNTARIKATEKLVDDLSDILESEEHSDLTIRVKEKEFRLHRNILSGRNPYFNSMFKADMKEKNTGIVSIDDCEPDIFQSFINFVYTGKLHALSCDNVCALYEVADKYQEDQLKSECLYYMKNEISVDSFVDFIVLAMKHDEKELLQTATDLFCKKIKEIIQSVKWQTFVQEYPIQSNELHIKALNYYVK